MYNEINMILEIKNSTKIDNKFFTPHVPIKKFRVRKERLFNDSTKAVYTFGPFYCQNGFIITLGLSVDAEGWIMIKCENDTLLKFFKYLNQYCSFKFSYVPTEPDIDLVFGDNHCYMWYKVSQFKERILPKIMRCNIKIGLEKC